MAIKQIKHIPVQNLTLMKIIASNLTMKNLIAGFGTMHFNVQDIRSLSIHQTQILFILDSHY